MTVYDCDGKMNLILLPNNEGSALEKCYHQALSEAVELYIASAYLTQWDIAVPLNKECKRFYFIVGKDFGLTRKAACQQVLAWLPQTHLGKFLVAEGIDGFHPKVMFWREQDGQCYALVGSSNLTKAAFAKNYEVNGYAKISNEEFKQAKSWIMDIEKRCRTLDQSWLDGYQEATVAQAKNKSHSKWPNISESEVPESFLVGRRKQMRIFLEKKDDLEYLFREALKVEEWSEQHNNNFYEQLNTLWAFQEEGSRFQMAGWERTGKASNFQELAKSMVLVLDAEEDLRDDIVSSEINRLAEHKIVTRGALFSEMLCQFFPEKYYVRNTPIKKWLAANEIKAWRGSTDGEWYIHSARFLRMLVQEVDSARNLAELDVILWWTAPE